MRYIVGSRPAAIGVPLSDAVMYMLVDKSDIVSCASSKSGFIVVGHTGGEFE